jgi:hypothetical protein
MNHAKRAHLEAKGWRVGDIKEFLSYRPMTPLTLS